MTHDGPAHDRDHTPDDLSVGGRGNRLAPTTGAEPDAPEPVPAPETTGEGGEASWAQPHNVGRPLVVGMVVTSALITLLLLLPLPDGPRRWVIFGLLVVLLALQCSLGVRSRQAGRRPLSPKRLRVAAGVGWMWGFFTGVQYVLTLQDGPGSALSGAFMGVFFGVFMWLDDPGRRSRG